MATPADDPNVCLGELLQQRPGKLFACLVKSNYFVCLVKPCYVCLLMKPHYFVCLVNLIRSELLCIILRMPCEA
jgi:hypothetical protein